MVLPVHGQFTRTLTFFQRAQSQSSSPRDNPGRPILAMRAPLTQINQQVLRRSVEPADYCVEKLEFRLADFASMRTRSKIRSVCRIGSRSQVPVATSAFLVSLSLKRSCGLITGLDFPASAEKEFFNIIS